MMQIPNLPDYNPIQQPAPNYNAVKIDVHNPMVNVPAQVPQAPQYIPQYAAPTMPYYNYPQAMTQPYYMPPVINTPEVPQQQLPTFVPPVVTQPEEVQPQAVTPAPAPVAVQEVPVEPVVVPPAPVVTEVPKAEEKKSEAPAPEVKAEAAAPEVKNVEVVAPEEIKPQVDLNEFLAKLTNEDYDVQAAAMEEIANMVDKEPQKATELLDTKVVDALTNIMLADSSALAGPTEAQQAARQKMFANQEMTDEEKQLAATITPKEQVERNKSYAMFTAAILQKLYGQEYEKLANATVPLTELPGAVTIVQQLKSNPNPIVRTSAIEALSYIQQPSYKKDLNTIFTIAQKDSDKGVQEAATAALAKLSEIPDMPENNVQA
jgi:hypothetical protein